MSEEPTQPVELDVTANRRALSGFFLSGILISFLGAVLPAWHPGADYHFVTIGYYFFSLNLGILAGVRVAHALLPPKGVRFVMLTAALLGCVAFLGLATVAPPWPAIWRDVGLFFLGASTGLLHTSIFYSLSPLYKHDPALTVIFRGLLHGTRCVLTAPLRYVPLYIVPV